MWYKIKAFITFLLKSTNQHGVHSPFVYNLVTKCFYHKTNLSKVNAFNSIKQWLYKNHQTITITDFGSGSKVFKNNKRKISDIAKIAGINNKKGLLLLRLLNYFKPQNILEIGTSVGLSTAILSIGNPNATINTLEGCANTAAVAQDLFDTFKLKNINLYVGNFKDTLTPITTKTKFDLIYFDGNHQKEATLQYFNLCLKTAHNNSIFIFDDINWSKEMQEAWLLIKNHPKVTVTIDTFFWGIVFFRKEQIKQHFKIRV
ncbi:methyltransferase [Lutibacter profundi]|uniref:Methyltransferase n=1 Tax=Lutibacter profundi TaxID=1622118 RepID=A0A109RMW4_9FLAO|nr:class I SAM-dependent methyltransferase [Lutibacter profundi]AMC09937.1 methyltransferase [Lutibacter profundi]